MVFWATLIHDGDQKFGGLVWHTFMLKYVFKIRVDSTQSSWVEVQDPFLKVLGRVAMGAAAESKS